MQKATKVGLGSEILEQLAKYNYLRHVLSSDPKHEKEIKRAGKHSTNTLNLLNVAYLCH